MISFEDHKKRLARRNYVSNASHVEHVKVKTGCKRAFALCSEVKCEEMEENRNIQ